MENGKWKMENGKWKMEMENCFKYFKNAVCFPLSLWWERPMSRVRSAFAKAWKA